MSLSHVSATVRCEFQFQWWLVDSLHYNCTVALLGLFLASAGGKLRRWGARASGNYRRCTGQELLPVIFALFFSTSRVLLQIVCSQLRAHPSYELLIGQGYTIATRFNHVPTEYYAVFLIAGPRLN